MAAQTVADEVRQHIHEYIVKGESSEGHLLPTTRELAKRCRASIGTVSSVLGTLRKEEKISLRWGRRSSVLNVEKTEKDYAEFLRGKSIRPRTNVLECVIYVKKEVDEDSYLSGLLTGIRDAAGTARYKLMLTSNLEASVCEQKKTERVDGMLIFAPWESSRDQLVSLKRKRIPFVLVNNRFNRLKVNYVMSNDIIGAQKAVQHLVELGHKRIALIAGPYGTLSEEERFVGYRKSLALNGIGYDPQIVLWSKTGNPNPEVLFQSKNPPTGIFVMNIPMAFNVIKNLKNLGIKVPDDVSVVGYDDFYGAEFIDPPLTTIRQPLREIGRQAVKALLDIIDGREDRIEKMLEPTLILRKSTKEYKLKSCTRAKKCITALPETVFTDTA